MMVVFDVAIVVPFLMLALNLFMYAFLCCRAGETSRPRAIVSPTGLSEKYEASIALLAGLETSSHAAGDGDSDDLDGVDSDGDEAVSSDEDASLDLDQVRRFAHATHIPCVVCCCRLCNVWCLVCARVSLWFCVGA